MRLPLTRLTRLWMSNPLQSTPVPQVHWVEFWDTTRIAAGSFHIAQDRLLLESCLALPANPEPVAMRQVARIMPARSDATLMDLSQLPMRSVGERLMFGLDIPPRLDQDTVELHAPQTLEFDLPQKTARLACTVRLATPSRTYTQEWDWAGCEVTLRVDRQTLATITLDAANPMARLNTKLEGQTLTVEIDESVNGPVMDRVLIEDAMLLVTPSPRHEEAR